MCENKICCSKTTSFQIGPDAEKDVVNTEALLMKLALATQTFKALADHADHLAANDGQVAEYLEPPSTWAISGAFQNLLDVSHALKAGCWGYRDAHLY